MSRFNRRRISQVRKLLHNHFGPLHWWPAESPFEVVAGAILTQNTAWTNVEKSIANLKRANTLSLEKLAVIPLAQLEALIKPSGFFRQKAVRLQHLAKHVVSNWQGSLESLCSGPVEEARARLIALPGIGPETADSILLYAAGRASFVVDSYTRRIFERVGLLMGRETYDEIRQLFMQNLTEDAQLYNDYHAHIVQLAKAYCRKGRPLCDNCPLNELCMYAKTRNN